MPSTYTLIKGETLVSSAASYTFTAIPSTFTDLVLRCSIRGTHAGFTVNGQLVVNGSALTTMSHIVVIGIGSSASSSTDTGFNYLLVKESIPGTTVTSNTFSSIEIYVPNYAITEAKTFATSSVTENNSSTLNYVIADAGLRTTTDAITSLTFQAASGNLVSGSSFYLYGIKNS
jgi:hypothetical protein